MMTKRRNIYDVTLAYFLEMDEPTYDEDMPYKGLEYLSIRSNEVFQHQTPTCTSSIFTMYVIYEQSFEKNKLNL